MYGEILNNSFHSLIFIYEIIAISKMNICNFAAVKQAKIYI